MKWIFSILVFGALVPSSEAQTSSNVKGHIAQEGDTTLLERQGLYWDLKDTMPDGCWSVLSQGRVMLQGCYHDNLRDGTFCYYSYTGQVVRILTYKHGLLDGPFLLFENGQLQTNGAYRNGERIGTWYNWGEVWDYGSDSANATGRRWELLSRTDYKP